MRVLLIEDNDDDAALVRAMLRDRDDPVEWVHLTRVGDALRALEREQPDVVVLDLSLPDGEGLDVFRRFRAARPHVPIVILSGRDDEALAAQAVREGAQDYLLKGSVGGTELRRALRYAVERERLMHRLSSVIEELQDQRTGVIRANQLKNDLLAVLAHDVKGPLTSILGFAELIASGVLEGDEARDAARTIMNNARRMADLANATLTLARIEHGELDLADVRVDVAALLEEVCGYFRERREIEISVSPGDTAVSGDPERLRQVFDNLIGNAVKYSPDGRRVDVSVIGESDDVVVTIRDRGIGIPPDEILQLFRRFARASNARASKIKGSGLGLFLVKHIVEAHGGSIALESAVGEGTSVTVRLPRSASRRNRPHVAVLSPDEALRAYLAYELRARGLAVAESVDLDDLSGADRMHPIEIALVDETAADPMAVRARLREGRRIALVGIGGTEGAGWDAVVPRHFLIGELLETLAAIRLRGARA